MSTFGEVNFEAGTLNKQHYCNTPGAANPQAANKSVLSGQHCKDSCSAARCRLERLGQDAVTNNQYRDSNIIGPVLARSE